jgi:carbonic anhydrase
MNNYQKIFEYNKKWAAERAASDTDFFENLAKEQHPEFLYIGCSDSRVSPNEMTGLDLGEMFVHRNIANIVTNADMSILSVLQFSVEVLKVKHIVVCGHYGCGGVNAAMGKKSLGLMDNWLREIRDVYRIHSDELDEIQNEHNKFDRLVELNVIEQCMNVLKTNTLQKHYKEYGFPVVHGWVYDMKKGMLIDLNFDFENALKKAQKIYSLTE